MWTHVTRRRPLWMTASRGDTRGARAWSAPPSRPRAAQLCRHPRHLPNRRTATRTGRCLWPKRARALSTRRARTPGSTRGATPARALPRGRGCRRRRTPAPEGAASPSWHPLSALTVREGRFKTLGIIYNLCFLPFYLLPPVSKFRGVLGGRKLILPGHFGLIFDGRVKTAITSRTPRPSATRVGGDWRGATRARDQPRP